MIRRLRRYRGRTKRGNKRQWLYWLKMNFYLAMRDAWALREWERPPPEGWDSYTDEALEYLTQWREATGRDMPAEARRWADVWSRCRESLMWSRLRVCPRATVGLSYLLGCPTCDRGCDDE